MDLFFELPKDVQRDLFGFNETALLALSKYIQRAPIEPKTFFDMSTFGVSLIPKNKVVFKLVTNPYKNWQRVGKSFQRGVQNKKFPNGAFKNSLDPNIGYIVDGFFEKGAYADVWTHVVYQGRVIVVKMLEEDEFDWFEIVSQAFLYEQCKAYKRIRVPRILFLQRSTINPGTHMCMERALGQPICKLKGVTLLAAVAHTMVALYRLQKDLHFMHRDLSGTNIMYEPSTHTITFIDFGMTWLNPTQHKVPWQMIDESFFDWREDKTMNRSLDASTLVAHSSVLHPWLAEQHEQMKRDYKRAIIRSKNVRAKTKLSPPRNVNQYTTIRKDSWYVGNELEPWNAETREGDGFHWWLFNMSSFEAEEWFPENVLKRVLRKLPLDYWFSIRQHSENFFDEIMPKDVRIRLDDDSVGTLVKLVRRKCRIKVGEKMFDARPSRCRQI